MRSALSLALVLVGAACASGAPRPDPDRVLVYDADGSAIRTTNDEGTREITIDAAFDRVVAATVASYERLGVPTVVVAGNPTRVGQPRFAMPRRFLDQPASRFFDCGHNLTGAVADQARLNVSILTDVRKVEGRSRVSTLARAVARPVSGANSEPMACGSTGRLESRLLNEIRAALP